MSTTQQCAPVANKAKSTPGSIRQSSASYRRLTDRVNLPPFAALERRNTDPGKEKAPGALIRNSQGERDPPAALRSPRGRGTRARRGQSPLAAAPARPRDAGPSGKHSCLITEQECTTGSLARLRHGHKRGCFQFARRNRASSTPRGVFAFQSATLSEKRAVTSWQPRTAGSDPPIAQAFITCLGPGTPLPALPACPPWRGGAEGAGRGARGRCPLPTRPQPSELVTASGRRAGSPGCSRLLPPLPFRLPGRPPRSRPGRLPRDRIPPLTSRGRDPAPRRRRERQHSRDALSTPAPPAASPPRGALSALRPSAPERSRPPQPRPASPLSPRRSQLPSPPPSLPPPRLSARPPGQLRVRGKEPLPAVAGFPGKPGRARAAGTQLRAHARRPASPLPPPWPVRGRARRAPARALVAARVSRGDASLGDRGSSPASDSGAGRDAAAPQRESGSEVCRRPRARSRATGSLGCRPA
ncbi:uncharacterized protein LOC127059646 [Serinus canaria]|uniref:uncharacterized protein LOC127059646 n=1 Tax=Serinus canaria TaxID=9135 RepID=UPI0021CCDCA0|nr:uncharacterized protein LOC127059646 [Serinus canaria]